MLIKQINTGAPERIFGIFQNNNATASVVGDIACLLTGTSVDGFSVEQPDGTAGTDNLLAFIGLWDEVKANGENGRVQTFGYNTNGNLNVAANNAATITNGDNLRIVDAMTGFQIGSQATNEVVAVYVGSTTWSVSATGQPVWIKGM